MGLPSRLLVDEHVQVRKRGPQHAGNAADLHEGLSGGVQGAEDEEFAAVLLHVLRHAHIEPALGRVG